MALLLLQYRFGKIEDIISDHGANLIPNNINPAIVVDEQERSLMSLFHNQTPNGRQHENIVESRIKLDKQYCFNIIGKVKGERFKPITLTQTDFIMATAINEVNNIPLFRHERYVFLTPNMLVNPVFEMSVGRLETDIISKYFDMLQPYLQLIADLRYDCFIKYVNDKRNATHATHTQHTIS